jgi:ATP-binding cassette, subfamily B, bacterial
MRPWWLRLLAYARPHRWGVAAIVALSVAGAGVAVLQPWPLKLILDHVLGGMPYPEWATWAPLPDSPQAQLLWLALASVALVALGECIKLLRLYIQTAVGIRMAHDLGAAVFEHIQHLSLGFHGGRSLGDLIRRTVKDATCVQDLVMGVFVPFLIASANLLFMGWIMWRLDPLLTTIAVAAAIPLAAGIRLFARPLTARSYAQEVEEGRLMTSVERALAAVPVVQAFAQETTETDRFSGIAGGVVRAHLDLTRAQIGFTITTSAATAVGTACIMGLGGVRVLNDVLTLGGLVVFIWYLAALYAPLETLTLLSSGVYASKARAQRVFQILDLEDRIIDPERPNVIEGGRVRGHVQFEDIHFGYVQGEAVLRGLTLEAQPGESIALVGPTGAGKTTIARLLLRFHDPWSGRVRADGVDIRELALAPWRAQIAFVPQEPFLLPISIHDNIAYGRPDASADEIVAAAMAANCHKFIQALPEGYETVIGERGSTLSGGEKQRISIARALLRDAPILVLDEPTAALDAQTERGVVDALKTLMKGRTSFVIAHRLSTIRDADRICFVEHGRIVEQGAYADLQALRGRFWSYQQIHGQG